MDPLPRGPQRHVRSGVSSLAVIVLVTMTLLAGAGPASAHAALVSSQPAPGSTLSAAPGVVTLRFTEPLIEELSDATVIAPTGEEFRGGPVGDQVMRVEVGGSAQGAYTVEWKTVSPLDGHTLRGSFQFGVGAEVGPPAVPSDAPATGDLLVATGRSVEYVGLLAMLGWLWLAAGARSIGSNWLPTGLHRWALLAAGGGLVTVVGELLIASGDALALAARAFVAAGSGPPRLGRLLVEFAAVVLVVREVRRSGDAAVSRRSTRVWMALLAVAALLLLSASGHAAAVGWLAILANAGHLAAAGVWAGTIIVMAVQRPTDGWTGGTGRRLLAEFAPMAAVAFGATVLLGALRGVQELAGLADLWETGYGVTLTLKVSLIALMVPLSLRAWRRRTPLPRTEAILALCVVVVAAVLAAHPVTPQRATEDAHIGDDEEGIEGLPQPGDVTLAGEAGPTVVGVTIRPGEPGVNDIYLYLIPRGGPEEARDLETTVTVEGSGSVDVRRCGVACRMATVSLDGAEQLEVEVSGDEGGTASVALPELPPLDGTELLEAADERMAALEAFAYDEVFGPSEPPTLSSWRVVAPDRLHGVITRGDDEYRETIRIANRRWNREDPDDAWAGGEPETLTVTANRLIWDQDGRTAIRIIDTDTVVGVETEVVSFFVDVSGLPVWYRLWVDEDHLVHRAEMRTQGHFMDHRYHRFDEDIQIRPPT